MNPLRLVLLLAAIVFVVLWLKSPKNPRAALVYLRWVLLAGASIVVLAPFVWLVAAAFKDQQAFAEYVFFPPLSEWSDKTMNLKNFRRLFEGDPSIYGKVYFWQYVLNSLFVATAMTVLRVVFCSAAGYALAKYSFYGKKWLTVFMLGSMMIPGLLLQAPLYGQVVNLGLVDTFFALLLPGMVTAYGIFLFRQACMAVPNEMLDAGRIDGCSEFGIYLRLVMPLVRPMCAAFCLVTFLESWNNFFAPGVFLQSQENLTLPVILNLYVGLYYNEYGVFLAGTLLAILPPALLFLVLEKEFVGGLTSGAVKG